MLHPEIQKNVMVKARGRQGNGWVPCVVVDRRKDRVLLKPRGHGSNVWHDLADGTVLFWSSRNPTCHVPPEPPNPKGRGPIRIERLPAPPPPPTPPSPPPPPTPPPPPEKDGPMEQDPKRNNLSFEEKLEIVERLAAIRAEAVPMPMSAIVDRLAKDLPHSEGFVRSQANLDRIMRAAKFPTEMILPEPSSLVKGSEIQVALASLSSRLSRIERELGLTP